MDDSEPTFSTEPSSSAMRARAFTWVFTRSCQSTGVFAEALMVLPLRPMLTAGITRETSPARCPAAWGAAQTSAGIDIRSESNRASPKAYGDFVFIEDSPEFTDCTYCSYWRMPDLSTPNPNPFAYPLPAPFNRGPRPRSSAKMKQRRGHIVMLFPPAGKTFYRGEEPAQQFRGRSEPLGAAEILQPLSSELLSVAVKCVRNPIRAEEHRIARLQSYSQRFIACGEE